MIENINTPAIAFAAGLITSIHCAGMCGPIACSLTALKKDESSRTGAAIAYHGGRLLSYSTLGAIFGVVGDKILIDFFNSPAVILPWFLVVIFIAIAFGLEKKIPRPAFFNRWTARLRFKAMRISATRGALVMGLATPLLPCTPLYLFFAACFATGSGIKGAEFALAFGLGTVPLLWATQLGFHKLQRKLGTRWMTRCRKGLALAAALMMAWRLHDTIPLIPSATAAPNNGPSTEQQETPAEAKSELPSCCH
ncbi:hypothetical protein NT6N_39040 [Oceaniferula spumae]|uniref:Urease accessory protein UreH-like transmembrane domain-containing protein n=1 Tax=Oceaniferula spumae TaxID=2979115 RepID=A0AAT9FSH5_9BACT